MDAHRIPLFAVLCLILGFSGCSAFSRPYPEKARYAIQSPTPQAQAEKAITSEGLHIQLLRVEAPYDGLSLVYKTGPSQFTMDYYHTFIASPDRLLTAQVDQYISSRGLFGTISSGASQAAYRYLLDGDVTDLYGDFETKGHPAAVIAIRFFLIDDKDARYLMLMQKTYQRSEALKSATPADLVQGWNRALQSILQELDRDIAATVTQQPAPAAVKTAQ